MGDKDENQWAFIFEQLGKEQLRRMLFRVAVEKAGDRRVVVEFDGDKAMDVTDHVNRLEAEEL